MDYNEVLDFWFGELKPEDWWRKDENLDRLIADRFLSVHAAAARCELYPWRRSPQGRLAEVIVLDQFSRNIFRGTARALEHDSLGLCLAQEAIAANAQSTLSAHQKAFLYMPFMHSESPEIHNVAVKRFSERGWKGISSSSSSTKRSLTGSGVTRIGTRTLKGTPRRKNWSS